MSKPHPESHPKPSINLFLKSLARHQGERGIAIILSGTGSDGADGCAAVKGAGGTVIVQEPDNAKYSGMPLSALELVQPDYVLTATGIGYELGCILEEINHKSTFIVNSTTNTLLLKQLLELVHKKTGVDFQDYKDATLQRRIARRMASCEKSSLDDYLQHVKTSPDELNNLQKDILISVTAFFRDGLAFDALEKVIAQILKSKREDDELRIWVPGCATGEEIYSIGIVVCEILGEKINDYRVQLFATDIDMDALRIARAGRYPMELLKHVPVAIVDKYFDKHAEQYEVKKKLRDMIIFARQDLVVDPPFLRQDLISCRNVMIYFKAELQNRILNTFHYSLSAEGVLFLGRSEGVFKKEDLFDTLSKDGKIFAKKDTQIKTIPNTHREPKRYKTQYLAQNIDNKNPYQRLIEQVATSQFLPNAILYNDDLRVQYIHGDCSAIISLAQGQPSFDLYHILRKELLNQLESLMHRATSQGKPVRGQAKRIGTGKKAHTIQIFVTKVSGESSENLYLLGYQQVVRKKNTSPEQAQSGDGLEEELTATRDQLQRVIHELESSSHEMQALNEEVQASNEELQSMNEELQSSNEELQSTNEELITINEELHTKTLQTQLLLNELESVQNSLDFPLLVVDKSLIITKFNTSAGQLFRIAPGLTKSLTDIHFGLNSGLMDSALKVIVKGVALDIEITDYDGRKYLAHIAPHISGGVAGALLLFIDQTEAYHLSQLNISLQKHEQWLRTLMDHSIALFSVKDISGRYTFINKPFAATFRVDQETIKSKTDALFFTEERCEWIRDQELEVMRQGKSVACEEEIIIDGQVHYFWAVRFPLIDQNGLIQAICCQATDISQRREMESQIRLSACVFERSMEAVVVMNSELSIIKTNEAFYRLTGFEQQDVVNQNIHSLFSTSALDKNTAPVLHKNENWKGAVWLNHRTEQQRLFWFSIDSVANDQGATHNHVALFYDITETYQNEKKIEYLATHDELTGLPNRVLLRDRLDQLLSRNQRFKTLFAIFFIDLDDFKLINDTHGHEAGDELLQAVSVRLSNIIRAQDTISRIGGDEFVVVQEFTSENHPELMATKILHALHKPIALRHHAECFVNASIGISLYPQDGETAVELMRAADTAMYRAKNSGPGQYQFFKSEMAIDINQRLDIINGADSTTKCITQPA